MQGARFSRKSAPHVVIVSPIAHERMGEYLPDPGKHNESLSLYTEAMQLTINGPHLTQHGDWTVAQLLAREPSLLRKRGSRFSRMGLNSPCDSRSPVRLWVNVREIAERRADRQVAWRPEPNPTSDPDPAERGR